MTHHIRPISGHRTPATVRPPLSLIVSLISPRLGSTDLAWQRITGAQQEAERLWRASIVAAAQLATPQDRLAAVERARDVAFTLWCDLAEVDEPSPDNDSGGSSAS